MGGCVSCRRRGNGVSTENRALEHGDSSPSSSKERGSRRWKQGRSNRGSVSDRIYGMVDFGFLSRGGGGGGGEEELNRCPGRMFVNGASDVACLFTQQGRKGTNQDAMLVWENFGSRNDTIFCGVFDGHGPFGHMVAKKVRDSLPLKLFTHLKANGSDHGSLHENNSFLGSMNSEETGSISMDDEWCESLDLEENEKLPEMYPMLKQALLKAFKLMDKELKMHPTIDCFCSGTTAVTLVKQVQYAQYSQPIICLPINLEKTKTSVFHFHYQSMIEILLAFHQGQDLVIGNVGDSRAVLGTRDKDNSMIAVQLTVDLKPNLPREAARIQQCKGRVFALQDEPEVARVWLPNNDSPGLAMARAFGDFCLKDFGLISVPDISYRRLTERDEFIVLATDGVWDVLSNKEVVDVVASAPSRATAARAVVDTAVRAWRLKFPTSKSDDCAVVCLFLDPSSSYDQCQEGTLENKPAEAVDDMVSSSLDQGTNMTNGVPKGSEPDDVREPKGSEPDGVMVGGSSIECSDTITAEIVPISELKDEKEEKLPDRCQSTRSLAECIATAEEEEWSALEGVTRVNSLLNLPRFGSGDKKAANWRKWL